MIHPAKNPQPNGFDLDTFAPSLDGVAGEALGTFLSDFQKGNNSMPKLPEVTVHVTTEPDPKEAHEFKASADLWAEQCRTLQRTLIDAQVEQDKLRDCASKFGTELILAKARVAGLEAENAGLLKANRDCCAWFDALQADHQKALRGLDRLARLGNEPNYGNSTGNQIAIDTINSLID